MNLWNASLTKASSRKSSFANWYESHSFSSNNLPYFSVTLSYCWEWYLVSCEIHFNWVRIITISGTRIETIRKQPSIEEKMFWKYEANLQENTHAKMWFHNSVWVSPVNFLHIFWTPFPKNTSWWLLLTITAICKDQSKY